MKNCKKIDSFIALIDPDVFESTGPKDSKHYKQWHVLTIDTANDSPVVEEATADAIETGKQLVDIWSTHADGIPKLQRNSKDLQEILNFLENGILPDVDQAARPVVLQAEHFQIIDCVLYHLHYPTTKRLHEIKPVIQQLCVPDVLREELLIAYHDNKAHIGRERLYETLKQKFYLPKCTPQS